MRNKIYSDGLGGFHGVSQTLSLGAKRLRYNTFHIFVTLMILTIYYNLHMYEIECFSFNLTMQSNNEIYKYIKFNQHYCRASAPPTRNIQFTKTCANILSAMAICSLFYILLLLSGDIHMDTGPASCSNAS